MSKLDASCGLSLKQIGTIKFAIKQSVKLKLPELPDYIETKLFIQGRDAWTYSWHLSDQDAQNPLHPISIEVDVKLKKEFWQYQSRTRYTFLCKLQLQPDIYSPIKSIRKKRLPDIQHGLRKRAETINGNKDAIQIARTINSCQLLPDFTAL